MESPSILFGALLLLLLTVLGLNVSRLRIKHRISVGHGDCKALRSAIRAHANAVEHIVPVMIGLWMLESLQWSTRWVMIVGGVFLLGRLLHGYGMTQHAFMFRRVGASLTYLVEIVLPIVLLTALFT